MLCITYKQYTWLQGTGYKNSTHNCRVLDTKLLTDNFLTSGQPLTSYWGESTRLAVPVSELTVAMTFQRNEWHTIIPGKWWLTHWIREWEVSALGLWSSNPPAHLSLETSWWTRCLILQLRRTSVYQDCLPMFAFSPVLTTPADTVAYSSANRCHHSI